MISRMDEIERVAKKMEQKRTSRGFVVTESDIDILAHIHQYRILRIEQIEALTSRTYTRVHRRVKGLFDERFLNRLSRAQKPDLYHIAERGVALLLAHGRITDDDAERRRREHELQPTTLDHEMKISDIHVTLELATRAGPMELVTWREGESLRDTFEVGGVFGVGARKVTIQPDAFFQLKDTRRPAGNNSRSFFLEVDRSTMPTKPRTGSQRFRDKVERYRFFIERGRAFERYGVQSIRIVTMTLTPERRNNLCADTEKFLAENNLTKLRKFFLFGSPTDISLAQPQGILAPVFLRPSEQNPYPLFPALAETAERA
jgi:Replication-relaxation